MACNKEELMNLPVEEKLELVEALWDRIDDDLLPVTQEEIAIAEERLQLHNQNPAGNELGRVKNENSRAIWLFMIVPHEKRYYWLYDLIR